MWGICKETMNTTAEEVCGWTIGKKKKRTQWWNEEVKGKVKLKKEA
jgi:hypothetical protein